MAKLNKERIIQAAGKYVGSGKLHAAVKEYEKWIAANPNDKSVVHKVADLCARMGEKDKAIKRYLQLVDHYRSEGFDVRAIATCKMILRLDPRNLGTMESLAELQERQGFLMEAKSQYQTLVELYSKSGQKQRVVDVFKKLAKLDPTDLRIRYRFAEFLEQEGRVAEAIEEYIGIADECVNMGLVSEAMAILEKGLRVDNWNRTLRLKFARTLVLQGDYAKAVQLLHEIQDTYPDDIEIMTRLSEAYVGAGHLDEAESLLGRLAEMEPDNPEHAGRMADLAIGRGDYDRALELLTSRVDEHVAQGDGDKAGSLLQKILNKVPHHIETLVKLAEVHTVLKNEHGRLSAYDRLCEAYAQESNFSKAVDVAEQLVGLEPENAQHRDRVRFLKSRLGGPMEDVEGAGDDIENTDIELELDPDDFAESADLEPIPSLSPDDEETINEKVTEAAVLVQLGLVDQAIDQLRDVLQSYRFHTGVRETLIEIYREQGMSSEASDELVELAAVYRRLGNEERAEELLQEVESGSVEVPDLSPEEEMPDIPSESEDDGDDLLEPDLEEDWGTFDEDEEIVEPTLDPEGAESSELISPVLQEVDEYIAMGLYEDARESLRELLEANPEDPALISKSEELRLRTAGSASLPMEPAPFFNPASELTGEILGRQEADALLNDPVLESTFREFKRGVERELDADDYDTRYNLGIAYKEMGLVDEAIAEFQTAAKDDSMLLECCSMLGLCFMEKGMATIAIKWFEKGLSLPERSKEEVLGLRYDLARAHEAAGDIDRARDQYRVIHNNDAGFRDVSIRVRELQAARK